jgi:hypothetical protein
MNRYPVENVRVVITWKSGAKTRYESHPLATLPKLVQTYIDHGPMSAIRKITVKEATS